MDFDPKKNYYDILWVWETATTDDINKIFAELEQQARKKQHDKVDETKENDPIESPEDAPQTQEIAPATSKTTEDTHGGDEASKEIKDSPNSVDGGENPDKENKSKKTKNTGEQGQGDGQGDEEKKKAESSKDTGSKGDGAGSGDKQDTEKKDDEKQEGDYFITTNGTNPSKSKPQTTPEDLQKAVETLFEKNDRKVNLKSILGVMSLGLGKGQSFSIYIEGEDEEEVLQELDQFLKSEGLVELWHCLAELLLQGELQWGRRSYWWNQNSQLQKSPFYILKMKLNDSMLLWI